MTTEDLSYNDVFPSKYLKADDVAEDGGVVLTINSFSLEEVGPEQEVKPVLRFAELDKEFILNKTNFAAIAAIAGDTTGKWVGKKIGLYKTPVQFAGKTSMGIRVRPA